MEVAFSGASSFDRRSKGREGAVAFRAQAEALDPPLTCRDSMPQPAHSFDEPALPGPMDEAHVALQHMREAVLGSIHGSKRRFKKCILFDIPPPEASEANTDDSMKLKIEDRRQEVLGARQGTPLRCRRVFSLDDGVSADAINIVESNDGPKAGATPAVAADVAIFRLSMSRHTRQGSCPGNVLLTGCSPRGKAAQVKELFPKTQSCDNRAQVTPSSLTRHCSSSSSSSSSSSGSSLLGSPRFQKCPSSLAGASRRSLLPVSLGLVACSDPTLLSSPGVDEGWCMEFSSPKGLLEEASSPSALQVAHGKWPQSLVTRSSGVLNGSLLHHQGASAQGLALPSHEGYGGGAAARTDLGRLRSFDSPQALRDGSRGPGRHYTRSSALVKSPTSPTGPVKASHGPPRCLPVVAQSEPVLALGTLEEEEGLGEGFCAPDLEGLRGELPWRKTGQVERTANLQDGGSHNSVQGHSRARWARKTGSFRQLLRQMTVDASALEGELWPQRRQAHAPQNKAAKGSSLAGQGARMTLDANTRDYYSTNG